jgi:hypothetical protein
VSERDLVIGGVSVPVHSVLSLRQSYTHLSARSVARLADGTGVISSLWSGRIATRIQASGWVPPGLYSVDWSSPQIVSCIEPLAMTSAGRVFTLPAGRRSDSGYTPYGLAYAGELWVETPVTLVGDEATLDEYPRLTMISQDGIDEDLDADGASYGWSLSAEEA